jgi:uncharacterized pyridoxamine 5'-phosphate oxidase family protein
MRYNLDKTSMQKTFLYNFIAAQKYAVLSTVTTGNTPEAALVGFAVTPNLEIIFDTVTTSRKYKNLMGNPSIAFVIGWHNEKTIQYEGMAVMAEGDRLEALLQTYFSVFPDGKERREKEKNLVYFSVAPKWIRYSDFNDPQQIEEIKL